MISRSANRKSAATMTQFRHATRSIAVACIATIALFSLFGRALAQDDVGPPEDVAETAAEEAVQDVIQGVVEAAFEIVIDNVVADADVADVDVVEAVFDADDGAGIVQAEIAPAQEIDLDLANNVDFDLDVPQNGQQIRAQFTDENLEQWIFNNLGSAKKANQKLNSQLNVQVDAIAIACEVTPAQREKLLLAGRGDIYRFFDQVDIVRAKFQKIKHDQNKVNQIFTDIQPLQLTLTTGLFGEDSFFKKVTKKTLNEEQWAKADQIDQERRRFRFQAKVDLVVMSFTDTLALRAGQREELARLLLETPTPKRFGQYDTYVVLYNTSKIPPEKLKKILDPPQWRALDKQLDNVRGLEAFLRQQKMLPEVNEKPEKE